MSELFHKLLILRSPGIGPVKYAELVARAGGDVAAAVAHLDCTSEHTDAVQREMENAARLGVRYISDTDDDYPAELRLAKNHPPVISVRGNIDTLRKRGVSMVGTRHASAAGMNFMASLAREFAENNFAVVSGMAMGTDTAAHTGALKSTQNAVTIAVLAGGVDYIWPLENERLYYEIIERGCVISEMPVGFQPAANNFVQRNRMVAGICERLILGEADLKSGSMHTARFAIDYKKQVFAIPSHPTDARGGGPNTLIRDGAAKICTGADDFFPARREKIKTVKRLSNPILDALGTNSLTESVLAGVVKKSIAETKAELVVLELQGLVRKTDGGYVKI